MEGREDVGTGRRPTHSKETSRAQRGVSRREGKTKEDGGASSYGNRESGERPRRPATPAPSLPPPACIPVTGKNEGPPGGYSDGPSIRLPSRRGSPYPRVVLQACGSLPASLSTTEVGDHDQDHGESCHFTSPPFVRFGLVDLVRNELLQSFVVLPAGLAAAEVRDHHENHRESRHHSPRLSWGLLRRSHLRAVHARSLEQPPCHLQCSLCFRL